MARHLPEYRYDRKVCRFKTWLLNQASWRVKDQLKKRKPGALGQVAAEWPAASPHGADDTGRSATINRVPDPSAPDLEGLFETEWRKSVFDAALQHVRQKFSLKQFQIFDLVVMKEWPAADVAQSLGVTLANVYVTRHRISAAIKKETRRLQQQLNGLAPLPK
jgi:RNA polymerase sigma factor (sigma-70 family)